MITSTSRNSPRNSVALGNDVRVGLLFKAYREVVQAYIVTNIAENKSVLSWLCLACSNLSASVDGALSSCSCATRVRFVSIVDQEMGDRAWISVALHVG